ncbi:unnamed protein product [Ilex paraguariensis]|uniref:Uncharacterized protein n=1 Tax=Ilex paraguariensis TaxID=185542 RepID=A0ABC8TJR7_9AQUA
MERHPKGEKMTVPSFCLVEKGKRRKKKRDAVCFCYCHYMQKKGVVILFGGCKHEKETPFHPPIQLIVRQNKTGWNVFSSPFPFHLDLPTTWRERENLSILPFLPHPLSYHQTDHKHYPLSITAEPKLQVI